MVFPEDSRQSGFTLVEVIATVAIFSLAMISVSGIFLSGANLFNESEDQYTAMTTAQIAMQRIEDNVKYAKTVTIEPAVPASQQEGMSYLYVNNGGGLAITGGKAEGGLFDPPKGYRCELSFTAGSSRALDVTVTVFRNEAKLYTAKTTVYMMGLAGTSQTIGCNEGDGKAGTVLAYLPA